MADLHPSGSILAVNCGIKCVLLPPNGRTPTTYTLTIGTEPTVGATSLAISGIVPAPTALTPLIIEDGTRISFGTAGYSVVAKNDVANVPYQIYTAGTTTTLKVEATNANNDPAANATGTTLGLLDLLGVQGMDQNNSTSLISIRSQKSGLGNEQRATMVSYEISVSGWLHQRDLAMKNVIQVANNESREIYAEVYYNDGRTLKGACGVSNLTFANQLDDVMKANFTLFFQGIPTTTYE